MSGHGDGNGTAAVPRALRPRPAGTRLQFGYRRHSSKIDAKQPIALRIETPINPPKGFKVYRTQEGEPAPAAKSWPVLRKGVADLDRRAAVAQAAKHRLAESLARVVETPTLGELLAPLGQPVLQDGRRRARALKPLPGADGTRRRLLGGGEWLVNGFRQADLRPALSGPAAPPTSGGVRRRSRGPWRCGGRLA